MNEEQQGVKFEWSISVQVRALAGSEVFRPGDVSLDATTAFADQMTG